MQRKYPLFPHVGVGALVIKEGKVLLVRRAAPPSEGLWAIPGGILKVGETLQEGAEREIKEETGITIRAKEPIYTFDFIEKDGEGNVVFHYVIVDLEGEYLHGQIRAADDASDCRWVSPEECNRLPLTKSTRKLLEEKLFLSSGARKEDKV